MTITGQTTSPLDTMREAGPNAHVQGVVTVEDTAQSGPADTTTGRNGSTDPPPEAISQPGPAHRPFAYPAWPTSKPGPQATAPLPGQHAHSLRTDQMIYGCYDQERGLPCVSPPRPIMYKQETKRPKIG